MYFLRFIARTIGIVLLLSIPFLFAVRPTEKMDLVLNEVEAGQIGTGEAMIEATLTRLFSPSIGEEELTDIAKIFAIRMQEQEGFPPFLEINGVKVAFRNGAITVKAALNFIHTFLVGPEVKVSPLFTDERFGIRIDSFRLGRLPLPHRFLMAQFLGPALEGVMGRQGSGEGEGSGEAGPRAAGQMSFTLDGNTIWIDGLLDQLPAAISISGVSIDDGRLNLDLSFEPTIVREALDLIEQIDFNTLAREIKPESRETYQQLVDKIQRLDPHSVSMESVNEIKATYELLDPESRAALEEQLGREIDQRKLKAFADKFFRSLTDR